jgi:hypothetical protein
VFKGRKLVHKPSIYYLLILSLLQLLLLLLLLCSLKLLTSLVDMNENETQNDLIEKPAHSISLLVHHVAKLMCTILEGMSDTAQSVLVMQVALQ